MGEDVSESLSKRSGKAEAWSSVTQIMAKLVAPIVNIVLARLLAPEAFGAVATITMIISFAEIFTDAGFQKYIIQHEFSSKEELNASTNVAFWTNLCFSGVIVALIVLFRNQIADFVGSPGLGLGIAVSSVSIILVAFSSIQTARFRRELRFKPLFFIHIGTSIMPLIVTVPLAIVLKSYWALVIGNLAINLFSAIMLTVFSEWKPKLFYSFKLLKEMFAFSMWTLFETVLIWLTTNVDILVVGTLLNQYYLGVYKTSMTTVNSYMSIVTSSIIPVLFATLSRCQNDDKAFKETFFKFQKYLSILIIPLSVGLFLYKDTVTGILLGSQWTEATDFVGLWGLMSGITVVFSAMSSEVYRSKGNPKLSMLAQIIHLVFLIPGVIISAGYGYQTLYITRSMLRIHMIITQLIIIRAVYKFSLKKMLTNIFPILIATAVMAAVSVLIQSINAEFWWQIICVLICVIVYFVALVALFPKTRREIMEIGFVNKILLKIGIGINKIDKKVENDD